MPSQELKNELALGQPIPKAVIDVANYTVSVEEQKRPEPEEQIAALRSEIEALKSKIQNPHRRPLCGQGGDRRPTRRRLLRV